VYVVAVVVYKKKGRGRRRTVSPATSTTNTALAYKLGIVFIGGMLSISQKCVKLTQIGNEAGILLIDEIEREFTTLYRECTSKEAEILVFFCGPYAPVQLPTDILRLLKRAYFPTNNQIMKEKMDEIYDI